jgi:hypothetical protein
MPKKDWIDKAAASGDWSIASQKAAAALRSARLARKAELALLAEEERQRVLAQQAERKFIALEAAIFTTPHRQRIATAGKLARAEQERLEKCEDWLLEEGKHFRRLTSEEEDRFWYQFTDHSDGSWAGISDPVGPPPDPPPNYGARTHVPGDRTQWWRYKHRGVLSAVEPGRHFGPSPPGTPPENPYYGYAPKMGRPRNPNKLSAAEKQRAYRQRRKEKDAVK